MKTRHSPALLRIDNSTMREALKKIVERADEGACFNLDSRNFKDFCAIAQLAREALAKATK